MHSALNTRRFSFKFITGQSQPRLSSSRRSATRPIAHPHKGGGQLPICRIFFTVILFNAISFNSIQPPALHRRAVFVTRAAHSNPFQPEDRDRGPDNGLLFAEWYIAELGCERAQPFVSVRPA